MTKKATAIFKIDGWDENPYTELAGGGKLTRVAVRKSYTGEIEGEGAVEYLMAYDAAGSTSFVGMETFVGRVKDQSGSVVFQHIGTFEAGTVTSTWVAIPGLGTGALAGLKGEVKFSSGHQPEYPITFDHEFAE